jgi:hypothetical protein
MARRADRVAFQAAFPPAINRKSRQRKEEDALATRPHT